VSPRPGGSLKRSASRPRRAATAVQLRDAEGQARRIVLAGQLVDYRLIRARRRTIGMQIGLTGLTVRASRWVTLREIEAALTERATWIVRTIAEWEKRRREVMPRVWRTGAPIVYRGSELALELYPARVRSIAADLFHLRVLHPSPQDERSVAAFVGGWLKDEALRMLTPHVDELAARVTDRAPLVQLSNARSEWGSCNHKGEIRLNWRLIQLPQELARYVVAHEVAHLVELNHSKRFWAVVESLFPGHAEAREELGEWTALLEV
jgi:predicted metal-dependent hydrolase